MHRSPRSHRGARGSRCLRRSPGVHVMRIARPRRTALVSPRAAHHARACRVRPFEARPPSTRSVHRAGFRPAGCRWRASLSLRASCRLLQTRRCTGIHRERVAPRTAAEGDDPSHAFAFGRPLAGTCTGDEPLRACFRRSAPARTGPTRAKVSFPLSRAESPSRTDPRTPLSCMHPRGRADPFSPLAHAPGDSPRANALRITAEVSGPAAPREGRCVRRRPRCVPPSCVRANREDRSSRSPERASLPRGTGRSGERRRFAAMGEPTPFEPPVVPSMTSQAPGAAQSNGT